MKILKSKLHQKNFLEIWLFKHLTIYLGLQTRGVLAGFACWMLIKIKISSALLFGYGQLLKCVQKKREKENQRDRPWRLGSVNFTTRVQNLTVTKPIRLELKSLEKLVNLIRLVRLTACCWSIWIKCLDQWKNNLLLASYQSKITKKLQTRAHSKSFSKTALAEEK